jgi:hypothetical protein
MKAPGRLIFPFLLALLTFTQASVIIIVYLFYVLGRLGSNFFHLEQE